jgi:D-alanine-D-alanine ligase
MKTKVAILCGGQSAEHEVSLMSSKNVLEALDQELFDPVVIKIDKTGCWSMDGEEVSLLPGRSGAIHCLDSGRQVKIDVVFPILHGPNGEDGTVQGLCELAGVPCVGAGVLGSSVGMDKDVMKRLLLQAGLLVGRYLVLHKSDEIDLDSINQTLGFPFFVKPANMGSSVGISKVRDRSQFDEAISKAFEHDSKIVIEEYIAGREIECSVLGNHNAKASVPGEIILKHDWYSYETKYFDDDGADLAIPADLTEEQTKQVQKLAVQVFKTLCCAGLGRVDLFLRDDGEFVVNEINTIPGFTKNSMYPKMWEASGISYTELITKLIKLAQEVK